MTFCQFPNKLYLFGLEEKAVCISANDAVDFVSFKVTAFPSGQCSSTLAIWVT